MKKILTVGSVIVLCVAVFPNVASAVEAPLTLATASTYGVLASSSITSATASTVNGTAGASSTVSGQLIATTGSVTLGGTTIANTTCVTPAPTPLATSVPLVISVPSMTVVVETGTETRALARGAGHYIKSVMPGESDNSVIAGHRDTVFASLGRIKIGAPIEITTRYGTYIYRVTGTRIVDRNDRTVIVPTESATVTLSTCYPFRFIGNAPQRFIVSALMVPTFS